MKKTVGIILVFGFIVITSATKISAEEGDLTLSTTVSEYVSGNGFKTTLTISNMDELAGLQVKLLYDETIYELASDQRHHFSVIYNSETPGEILVSFANATTPSNGDMELITLSFTALSDSEIGLNRDLIELDASFENEFIRRNPDDTLSYVDAVYDFGTNRRYQLGDLNKDDKITTMDITMMQLYLAEIITLCEFGISAADISSTGELNIYDILRVQEYVVGLTDSVIQISE